MTKLQYKSIAVGIILDNVGMSESKTVGSSSARPLRRRRTRLGNETKIQDDEFMAAAIGDVEWLRQSLRDQNLEKGQINYDKNVSYKCLFFLFL